MWQSGWRDRAWIDLGQTWDIIIVGGGITGAGILREATRAGLRALLLEAHDFAAGTSSRSSKLVHGGFRYLRNAQVRLTFQAVRERERLLKEGRGLVNPLGCLLANYRGDSLPGWVFGAGLALYDLLALKWGHRRYDAYDMQALCPSLCDDGLSGGYRFFDAQTDDARLVLRLIQESVQEGALALNYAPVTNLLRQNNNRHNPTGNSRQTEPCGQVCGVVVRDASPHGDDREREVFGSVVINAAGVWADDLRRQVGGAPRLRRLRGSHLVIPAYRLPLTRSVNLLHPRDDRPVFAYVWEGVTIVGTTDIDHDRALEVDPPISSTEVEYLLEFLQHAFPGQALTENDVQATFSGIRPVINTGKSDPSKESREHVIWSEDGLVTITGGKLTTFRLMAFVALNSIRKRLPGKPKFDQNIRILNTVSPESITSDQLSPVIRQRILGRYGRLAPELVHQAKPGEFATIGGALSTWAELRWAAHAEGAAHLDDLLLRRLRLGLLLPNGGLNQIDQIRIIVQPEMGWDDATWDFELDRYREIWRKSYSIN